MRMNGYFIAALEQLKYLVQDLFFLRLFNGNRVHQASKISCLSVFVLVSSSNRQADFIL